MDAPVSELTIAERDFSPVPADQRQRPARVPNVSARLYIDRVTEHRDVVAFLTDIVDLHGEGTKTIVRSLIHYRDTVIGANGRPLNPVVALRDFTPIPRAERPEEPAKPKNLSARLYIDKWREHRDAFEFLSRMQNLHGDGAKTLVRALLHYRDTVVVPREQAAAPHADEPAQLTLDAPGLRPRPKR